MLSHDSCIGSTGFRSFHRSTISPCFSGWAFKLNQNCRAEAPADSDYLSLSRYLIFCSALHNRHLSDIWVICQKCKFEVRKGWKDYSYSWSHRSPEEGHALHCQQAESAILKNSLHYHMLVRFSRRDNSEQQKWIFVNEKQQGLSVLQRIALPIMSNSDSLFCKGSTDKLFRKLGYFPTPPKSHAAIFFGLHRTSFWSN